MILRVLQYMIYLAVAIVMYSSLPLILNVSA